MADFYDSEESNKAGWDLPLEFVTLLSQPFAVSIEELDIKPITTKSTQSTDPTKRKSKDAFISAMQASSNLTTTEKGGTALQSTTSALVDLFFDFTAQVGASQLFALLDQAWSEDPISIIFHARSIHEGKGIEEGFFRAMAWLYDHHPRTMLENLHLITDPICKRSRNASRDEKIAKKRKAREMQDSMGVLALNDDDEDDEKNLPEYPPRPHGCFDDLNNLLILCINGQLKTTYTGPLWSINETLAPATQRHIAKAARISRKEGDAKSFNDEQDFGGRLRNIGKDDFRYQLWSAPNKKAKHLLLKKRFDASITSDTRFQALYVTIVNLYVKQIRDDIALLDKHKDYLSLPTESREDYPGGSSPHLFGMSYAAKWIPTPQHGADKQVYLATAIGIMLFPGVGTKEARRRLQAEILTPLRGVMRVPEATMKRGSWEIDYTKVPSRSMARNSENFMAHDPAGFEKYLVGVARGKKTISGASVFPHELLIDAVSHNVVKSRIADLQWRSLVESIASTSRGKLNNCLAVADVSGSMGGLHGSDNKQHPQPITASIALTLLLGELSEEPWRGSFLTFSSQPTFETIPVDGNLSERAQLLSRAHWGQSTDFDKIFELILSQAKNANLPPEKMIGRLFVFSDMQFDEASEGSYGETVYQTIRRRFEEAGYTMPEIVFWNLSGNYDTTPKPVAAQQEGVALMSGFSGSLMKFFLGQGDNELDEEMANEMDKQWEKVGFDEDSIKGEGDVEDKAEGKSQERKNPLETVMRVIGAESLKGVVVVD